VYSSEEEKEKSCFSSFVLSFPIILSFVNTYILEQNNIAFSALSQLQRDIYNKI